MAPSVTLLSLETVFSAHGSGRNELTVALVRAASILCVRPGACRSCVAVVLPATHVLCGWRMGQGRLAGSAPRMCSHKGLAFQGRPPRLPGVIRTPNAFFGMLLDIIGTHF